MVNDTLTQIDAIISKDHDVIKDLDNDYNITLYSPEVIIQRGKYGFNIMPQNVVTRELTGLSSFPNLFIDIFMHYDLEADDKFQPTWGKFMIRANTILNALYAKTNIPSGISTIVVNIAFDNPIIEKERIIDITYQCEYRIFATR